MGRYLDLDDVVHNHPQAALELAQLRADVDRLKEQVKIEQGWVKQYRDSYGQSVEKIERLRALLKASLKYVERAWNAGDLDAKATLVSITAELGDKP